MFSSDDKKELAKIIKETVEPMFLPNIQKLVEHDERFERLEERIRELPTRDELYTMMDSAMARVSTCEEEHAFLGARISRCEDHLGFA